MSGQLSSYSGSFIWQKHEASVPSMTDDGFDVTIPDVVVVGSGPTGLAVAAGLGNDGLKVVLIGASETVCATSRANAISHRTLDTLDRLAPGLARELYDLGTAQTGGTNYFGESQIVQTNNPPLAGPGARFARTTYLCQWFVEDGLARHIDETLPNVDLRWASRVTEVQPDLTDPEMQVVRVHTNKGDYKLRAPWVVAADGGKSTLRKQLGQRMTGHGFESTYVIVDVEVQGPPAPPERTVWFDPPFLPGGLLLRHITPNNLWRLDFHLPFGTDIESFMQPDNIRPIVDEHLRRVGRDPAGAEIIWITTYTALALSLDDYLSDRILFAGDAAHLVPIFGGFGLNSGMDDAANLVWKLAAVVRGQAPVELLRSYSSERVHTMRRALEFVKRSAEYMIPSSVESERLRTASLTLAAEGDALAAGLGTFRPFRTLALTESPLNQPPDQQSQLTGAEVGLPVPQAYLVVGSERVHILELMARRAALIVIEPEGRPAGLGPEDLREIALGHDPACVVISIGRDGGRPPAQDPLIAASDPERQLLDLVDLHGGTMLVRPDGLVAATWRTPTVDQLNAAIERLYARSAH